MAVYNTSKLPATSYLGEVDDVNLLTIVNNRNAFMAQSQPRQESVKTKISRIETHTTTTDQDGYTTVKSRRDGRLSSNLDLATKLTQQANINTSKPSYASATKQADHNKQPRAMYKPIAPYRKITHLNAVQFEMTENVAPIHYLKCLPPEISPQAITAMDKSDDVNPILELVFCDQSYATKLIELGLTFKGQHITVNPARIPSAGSKVTVKAPYYIDDNTIINSLSKYGDIKSMPKSLSYGYMDIQFRHIRSFKKELFIKLSRPIPPTLTMVYNDIEISTTIHVEARCFYCSSKDHKIPDCPKRKQDQLKEQQEKQNLQPTSPEPPNTTVLEKVTPPRNQPINTRDSTSPPKIHTPGAYKTEKGIFTQQEEVSDGAINIDDSSNDESTNSQMDTTLGPSPSRTRNRKRKLNINRQPKTLKPKPTAEAFQCSSPVEIPDTKHPEQSVPLLKETINDPFPPLNIKPLVKPTIITPISTVPVASTQEVTSKIPPDASPPPGGDSAAKSDNSISDPDFPAGDEEEGYASPPENIPPRFYTYEELFNVDSRKALPDERKLFPEFATIKSNMPPTQRTTLESMYKALDKVNFENTIISRGQFVLIVSAIVKHKNSSYIAELLRLNRCEIKDLLCRQFSQIKSIGKTHKEMIQLAIFHSSD